MRQIVPGSPGKDLQGLGERGGELVERSGAGFQLLGHPRHLHRALGQEFRAPGLLVHRPHRLPGHFRHLVQGLLHAADLGLLGPHGVHDARHPLRHLHDLPGHVLRLARLVHAGGLDGGEALGRQAGGLVDRLEGLGRRLHPFPAVVDPFGPLLDRVSGLAAVRQEGVDHPLDLPGAGGDLLRKGPDLVRHHAEGAAVFPGLGRDDGGVERQEAGPAGHLVDHLEHAAHPPEVALQAAETGDRLLHGPFDAGHGVQGLGHGRLPLVRPGDHGAGEFPALGRPLPQRGGHALDGRGGLADGLGGAPDLGREGRHLGGGPGEFVHGVGRPFRPLAHGLHLGPDLLAHGEDLLHARRGFLGLAPQPLGRLAQGPGLGRHLLAGRPARLDLAQRGLRPPLGLLGRRLQGPALVLQGAGRPLKPAKALHQVPPQARGGLGQGPEFVSFRHHEGVGEVPVARGRKEVEYLPERGLDGTHAHHRRGQEHEPARRPEGADPQA